MTEFRFYRSEIYYLCDVKFPSDIFHCDKSEIQSLCDAFEIPNETRCYNSVKVDFLPGITLQWCIGSSCRQNS